MKPGFLNSAAAKVGWPAYIGRALGIGLASCGVAALGYLFLLQARIGGFAFGTWSEAAPSGQIRAVLVDSDSSRRYLNKIAGASSGGYDKILARWERLLTTSGVKWRRSSEEELSGNLRSSTVLVLPAGAALAEETLEAVEDFVVAGGSLVVTWQVGLRDERGKWRGFDRLARWVSFQPAEWRAEEPLRYLTLRASSPLTVGISAGARLEFFTFDQPMVGSLAEPVGLWTNWAMHPAKVDGRRLGGAAASDFGNGRIVWLAFPVTLVGQGERDQVLLRRLVKNSLYWAAHRPLVDIAQWPRGAPAAAAFAMDTEHRFTNARQVARVFSEELAPVTFFCVSDLALGHSGLVAELAKVGEIGSHTDNHQALAGMGKEQQEVHLEKSRNDLTALSGQPVRGFRPPEEKIDSLTLSALKRAGYWYIAGDAVKPAAVPRLQGSGQRPLMIVPRVPMDDYDLVALDSAATAAGVANKLEAELDRVRLFGGLYFLSFHTQWLGGERFLPALRDAIRHARADGAWLATFGDLYRWWVGRSQLRAAVKIIGPRRLELQVSNQGVDDVRGAVLDVYLPEKAERMSITPDKIPSARLSYELLSSRERVSIEIARLGAGVNERYFIDLEIAASGQPGR